MTKNRGWVFTFVWRKDEEVQAPVTVVVLGEVGDPVNSTWVRDGDMFYEDEDHAQSIARDAVMDKFEVAQNLIDWVGTATYMGMLTGLKEVDIGVWI